MYEIIESILAFSLIVIIFICCFLTGDLLANVYDIIVNNSNINNQRLILDMFGAACIVYMCANWKQNNNE